MGQRGQYCWNHLRLLKLVNTLMDFARIEAGGVQACFQPTDLAALTTDLASVFRSAADRAGLRLLVDCPPLPETVYVDREMWEKIVLNLLSNAIKHTFAGEIAVLLRATDGHVALEVCDTGTGIAAEEIPRLFERFHRIRDVRARTHEGAGIGLALVQELVRLHGGTVQAESIVGERTCFTVMLPLGAAHLPSDQLGPAGPEHPRLFGAAPYLEEALRWSADATEMQGAATDIAAAPGTDMPPTGLMDDRRGCEASPARHRMLIADDNADMRTYLRGLLSGAYEVRAEGNGAAALAAARAQAPDLILADVMMPGLDGFALLRALRADSATREIPVMLLSARAGEESTVEALQAGADDYLVKPFSARELIARVRARIELAGLRTCVAATERALRSAAEAEQGRLHEIFQQAPVMTAVLRGPEHVFELANALYQQGTGRTAGEILGLDVVGRPVPMADPDAYATFGTRHLDGNPCASKELPLERALLRNEVVQGDQFLIRNVKNGRDVPVLANAAPLRDVAGAVTGGVVVFQDITAIRDVERLREEFLSSAAHDLKTPLTTIRGHAELVQRRMARAGGPEAASVLRGLARIEEGTDAMLDLINQLLDTTRQQMGGGLDLSRQPTDLLALVRGCVEAQREASGRTLTLETDLADLHLGLDRARITRVVGNLLSNALKYSPTDRSILVRVAQETEANGPEALIAVTDQGIGIPAADLPLIFERFRRASNVVGRVQGTGIGLASALGIVTQHGGTISVESKEGEGSTFTVRLPLAG